MTIRGIDVSAHQGRVDWHGVKAEGYGFAFVKATEGAVYTSATFKRNWQGTKEAGLLRGAYHYFLGNMNPEKQAEHFLNVVQPQAGDLPPVLDIEVSRGVSRLHLAAVVLAWLKHVEAATGLKPIIYTYPSFWRSSVGVDMSDYPLWIAHYRRKTPSLPKGWKDYLFWQYDDRGHLSAVQHNPVDLNVFQGSQQQLQALTRRTAKPIPA
jgi:lysozyme